MDKIFLNDILGLENIENVKIRFNIKNDTDWDPIAHFKDDNVDRLLEGQYWNYKKQKSYREGQLTIGFIRINDKDDLWLLFHVGKVTKDLDVFEGVGYEYEELAEYKKYIGRLIIRYKNRSQNMVRRASSVIDECEVDRILEDSFDNDIFPGYDNVNISWQELSRVVAKESWKTALQNQKGVYLITDRATGKLYVGSAYGEQMLLGRWQAYLRTGHGGNKGLKELDFDYIKENFSYSILEIFKSTIDDKLIIMRESWWKTVLMSKELGYNEN